MEARSTLAECSLFLGLSAAALDNLSACAETVTVRGGDTLFLAGEPSDALFIVATGRLRATLPNGQIAGDIARLEPIGEIGVLASEPRGATIHALRDSQLYRFSREAFYAFVLAHPAALVAMSRVIVGRLRQNARDARLLSARRTRTFAVMAATPDLDASGLSQQLHVALSAYGSCVLVTAAMANQELGENAAEAQSGSDDSRLLQWLNRLEIAHEYLIYDTSGASTWLLRALRQADRTLVYADAGVPPSASANLDLIHRAGVRTPIDAILRRSAGVQATLAWKAELHASAHYFLRPGIRADVASLARQLTGRGVGLVLGGGGARGFAHIGLLRAVDELHIPIDLIGGTSMGAFISALHAQGHDWRAITQITRDTFVSKNYLSDYMIPRVSLIEGKKFRKRLLEIFGDTQIEHLRMPYYSVTTNLTRGAACVHDQGPLATWVGTSMCIPGFAPPVAWNGDLFVDGAIVNSLPTDVMQNLARGPIIASDVSTEGGVAAPGSLGPDFDAVFKKDADGKRVSLIDIMFRTSTLTSESGVQARAARADLYVRMPVSGIQTFDWKLIDAIVEKGYRHALVELPKVIPKLQA